MNGETEPILIYVLLGSQENADLIARRIIEARLGACVNLLAGVKSIYEWEGDIAETSEIAMFVKSVKAQEAKLIELIAKLHDYDEPAIVVLPITGGAEGYLSWAAQQVT